jgi:methylamine dehydrogenase heavy chain
MGKMTLHRVLGIVLLLAAGPAGADLPTDPMGEVRTLPATWPPHWIIAHDISYTHIRDGKTFVLDADANRIATQFKGMINSSFAANFLQATTRPELYVAETFYSRGTRGERLDVLTIYDKRTLAPVGEVLLEANQRAFVIPQRNLMQLTADESLLLIYNFSPAMSVSVVDVVGRRYLGEVPTPGCAAIYPTGLRGFSALCGDGSLYTAMLDGEGEVTASSRSEVFFDVQNDPLMEQPAWVDERAHFVSYLGNVVPVDFRGERPVIGQPWSLLDADTQGWRPGGLVPTGEDANGRMYVTMHPDGREGSHKDPGVEVWVLDPAKQLRLNRLPLQVPGLSIALTRDAERPLMIVTDVEMKLDVYDAGSGELLRALTGFGELTPIIAFGAE